MDKNFYSATAVLIGTIVGVGIFGIPYTVARSGFALGLFFLAVLGLVFLLLHLFYGEIVLRTLGKHRFVGYAQIYLGKWGKRLTSFTSIFINYGALLAYMIVGGKFLEIIFGGSEFNWSLIFFIVCSLAIFFGLRVIVKIELFMSLFLIITIFLIFIKGWPAIDLNNLSTLDWKYFFLPYGVILWAIGGLAAIPEMKEVFKENYKSFKKAIIVGTLLPVLLYVIFVLTVVGVTGSKTSPEAINGLVGSLGSSTVVLGAVFGLLAVTTSFLVIGLSLKKIFWYDYGANKHVSWVLTCLVPVVAFLLHWRDFIVVIGFLGAILGGLDGILLILIYRKAKKIGQRKPEYSLKIPSFVYYSIIFVFSLGIIYQIIFSF